MRTVVVASLLCCLSPPLALSSDGLHPAETLAPEARLRSQQMDAPVPLRDIEVLRERVGAEVLERQFAFLHSLPAVKVEYAPRGATRRISGSTGIVLSNYGRNLKAGDTASEVLVKFGAALLARNSEELRVAAVETMPSTHERVIKLEQSIRGIPVLAGEVNLGIDQVTGEVTTLTAEFLSDYGLPTKPTISGSDAKRMLLAAMRAGTSDQSVEISLSDVPPELAYAHGPPGSRGTIETAGHLVWLIGVTERREGGQIFKQAWVDATNGEILGFVHTVFGALNRKVYSGNNQLYDLGQLPTPLTPLFDEGGSSSDPVAMNAYWNANHVYNAFLGVFNRDSMDRAGNRINIVVHWGTNHGNAYHARNGGQDYLLFGDGQSSQMPFGNSVDVVAHEFGHGVVRAEKNFVYADTTIDSGAALHEAFADFASTVVDAWSQGSATTATWTIGEVYPSNSTQGLRYLHAPVLKDVRFRDWYPRRAVGGSILGGTHYHNSTIFGHALYLLSVGGTHYRAGTVGTEVPTIIVPGIGYTAARDVFYNALRGPNLTQLSGFLDVRYATIQASLDSATLQAVAKAWDAVGVGYGCSAAPPIPILQLEDFMCHGRYRVYWNSVPGATTYHAQRVRAGWSWSLAETIVDGNFSECMQEVSQTTYVRLRACNGCGCSGWSAQEVMQWYPQCL